MTSSPAIDLGLGDFNLFGAGKSWRCETIAAGTDLSGNPQPVEVAIRTLIQDGSVSFTEKYDNATIPIVVCLSAPNAEALDEGAAALFAELGRPNVLTYRGPLAFGPVAWDVVNSRLERNSDDLGELRGDRFYTVTLTVLPFRRATEQTLSLALPTGTTTTVVDDCSAATGWTALVDENPVTPTATGGAITAASTTPLDGEVVVAFEKSLTGTTTSTNLLVVDWKESSAAATVRFSAYNNGAPLPLVSEMASPTAGYVRSHFLVTAPALGVVRFEWISQIRGLAVRSLSLDYVAITDAPPTSGTGRQRLISLAVDGSARTAGTLRVESETTDLGDVKLYVYSPSVDALGYSPPMRQFRILGGTVTSDSARISGKREVLDSTPSPTFQIPAVRLPRGPYLLMAHLAAPDGDDGTYEVEWNVAGGGASESGSRSFALGAVWKSLVVASVTLPTVDLSPRNNVDVVQVTLSCDDPVRLDEAWLFHKRLGTLIHVDVNAKPRLFVEPSTVTTPRPTLWVGDEADQTDARHPAGFVKSWQFPEFRPPQVNVLTVCDDATDAVTSLSFYERKAG